MLIGVFRVIVNKPYYESFDITFIENIKNRKKKLIALSFFYKNSS